LTGGLAPHVRQIEMPLLNTLHVEYYQRPSANNTNLH
jgi:hypothetical protein